MGTSSAMSDGESALQTVQACEQKKKRGPENHTLSHWNEPKATIDCKSKLRWLFKCRYCNQIRTFPRTLKDDIGHQLQYNNEPHKPRLGNLATHTKEHAGLIARREAEKSGNDGRLTSTKLSHTGFTLASARLMEKYVQDGLLNPRIEPTQSSFTRLFVAWLVEQDLPFTTGKFAISELFKYIQCQFSLPSNTAVRKSVAQIFTDLHSTIVRETMYVPPFFCWYLMFLHSI
ncbi:hypothetical protein EDB89DRAFT_1859580 [Lactarius sanguifluus]|nr:hypothetical protein EDB89DRAFT_1859580 [Lactarius sanguifluus]